MIGSSIYNFSSLSANPTSSEIPGLGERESLHNEVLKISKIWGAVAIFTAILVISGLILLFGAVLIIAFLFSDINVLIDVVFPVILPILITLIVVGIPLIILILKNQKKKNAISKQIAQIELSMIKGFYDRNPITKPDKRLIGEFIEKEILISKKNKFYLSETLENIKKELPPKKQREKEDQNLIEGIEQAQENIKLSKQARKNRDDKEAKEKNENLKNKKT